MNTERLVAFIALAFFVRGQLLVAADNTATSITRAPLFRLGFSADAIGVAFFAVMVALVYGVFKSKDKGTSLLAACSGFMGCAIQLFACLFHSAPRSMSLLEIEPLQSMALAFLKLNARAFNVGLIFFGIYGLLIGYLAFRSRLTPRFVAVLMTAGGLAYVINSAATVLAAPLSPWLLLIPVLGEVALMLWYFSASRRFAC